MNREIDRCRQEIAAIEGLVLALSDWSAELRILQNEERRQEDTRRRDGSGMGGLQAFTE